MPKTLSAQTIIPNNLYVERKADRQVESILLNMGRPGYVLVARQMGKTNLLLHARRKFQGSDTIFAYLDVSNKFPDLRSFLRNIIDTIVETSTRNVIDLTKRIQNHRLDDQRLPHKEHEWELREIIRTQGGKLIICLDEIDALTTSDYSDQVFSFIRSVYFSGRVNFAEFSQLTYLLSGVAEPADIIKNRDVSPFNIGEKIFLEDFSYNELENLIDAAHLPISDLSRDRIFYWTNGNPRMSWDICSSLEDAIIGGHIVTPTIVDHMVDRLYFSDIDVPPVDHMKRLVEENGDIRDALISLHYGHGESISDSLRTRLYLAGIGKISKEDKRISFKNRILEDALSEEFLLSLRAGRRANAFDEGRRHFELHNYSLALERFNTALLGPEDSEDAELSALISYWIGRCEFSLSQYLAAAASFQKSLLFLVQDRSLAQFYLATSFFRARNFESAVGSFDSFLLNLDGSDASSNNWFEAKGDLATCIVALRIRHRFPEAEDLAKNIISNRNAILNSPGAAKQPGATVALAYMALADVCVFTDRSEQAKAELELASELATRDIHIQIVLAQVQLESARDARAFHIAKCVVLIHNTTNFGSWADASSDRVSYQSCYAVLSAMMSSGRASDCVAMLDHIFSCMSDNSALLEATTEISDISANGNSQYLTSLVVERALRARRENLDPAQIKSYIVTICLLNPGRIASHQTQYLEQFSIPGHEVPTVRDMSMLNGIIDIALSLHSRALVDKALSVFSTEPVELKSMSDLQRASWSSMRDYLRARRDLAFAPDQVEVSRIKELILRLGSAKSFELAQFKPDLHREMQVVISQELRQHAAFRDERRDLKLGRNQTITVDYAGTRKVGKYKKFLADIESGKCKIVDINFSR